MTDIAIPLPDRQSAPRRGPARPRARAIQRLRSSVPTPSEALAGSYAWGAAMACCLMVGLYGEGWQTVERVRQLALVYFAGAAIGFAPALLAARFLSFGRSRETAFAALLLMLTLATIAFTVAIFALEYRVYYAEWHAAPLTKIWLIQLVYTAGGAVFQFAVLGTRLYVPYGLAALFAASFWFSTRPR